MNPIDWLVWLHSRYFVNNEPLGYVVFAAVGAIALSVMYMFAIDKYKSQHRQLQDPIVHIEPENGIAHPDKGTRGVFTITLDHFHH